jgi:hypothetical protein
MLGPMSIFLQVLACPIPVNAKMSKENPRTPSVHIHRSTHRALPLQQKKCSRLMLAVSTIAQMLPSPWVNSSLPEIGRVYPLRPSVDALGGLDIVATVRRLVVLIVSKIRRRSLALSRCLGLS